MTLSVPPRTPAPFARSLSARSLLLAITVLAAASPHGAATDPPLARVEANDNGTPAGTLVRDTLRLKLAVVRARWFPEADNGPFVDVIELGSYSDGVAGWSGMGNRLAPMIAPADSFTAHLTLARAGTFIYHTHLVDVEQFSSGLFGAIVVLEPGRKFDPVVDHIFVAGWDGIDDPERTIFNGETEPTPLVFEAGRAHRLRFVGIGLVRGSRYTLTQGSDTVQWRAIAKDGADLPPSQATVRRALVRLQAGETYDFEWKPAPGEYVLAVTMTGARPPLQQKIVVR